MAKASESGQIVIEMAVVALLMVGLFLLAVSIAETGNSVHRLHRFSQPKGKK
ncbi:MAG: hypothetical protein AAB250_03150 [Bdellovibrionota bacterium]